MMSSPMRRGMGTIWYRLQRLKTTSLTDDIYSRNEARLHSIFDLVLVGLWTTLPMSVFILSGHAAKDLAGPSAILSLLFAALASGLSGLSYTELRARVYRLQAPAYEYIYRVIGEAAAFTIGWLFLLHHVTCTSAAARAISQNLDYLLEGRISNLTITHVGDIPVLNSYLDFVAFFLGLLAMLASVMDLGMDGRNVKLTSVTVSLAVLLFVLVVGLYHLDFHHWQDVGSFFPQGIGGVMGGAGVLTYAFWGSESILRSCDLNSRDLRKPAMVSTVIVHIFTLVVLILTLSAITLLSSNWVTDTPFPEAFTNAGIPWVRYVICPVAILILATVLLYQYKQSVASLCQLASDGLLPVVFSKRSSRTDTPLVAIIVIGISSSLPALIFSVSDIVQVLPIPIVLVQATSSVITMCFHYKAEGDDSAQRSRVKRKHKRKNRTRAQLNGSSSASSAPVQEGSSYGATVHLDSDRTHADLVLIGPDAIEQITDQTSPLRSTANNNNNLQDGGSSSDTDIDDIVEEFHHERSVRQLTENTLPADYRKHSTAKSFLCMQIALTFFVIASTVLGLLVSRGGTKLQDHNIGLIVVLLLSIVTMLASAAVIFRQTRDSIEPYTVMMYVHHVPWPPLVALAMNVMMCVAVATYHALFIFLWILAGTVVYFLYGMSHSHEAMHPEHYPEEHRGLIHQHPASQRPLINSSQSSALPDMDDPGDVYRVDRDDDQLLDCS